MMIFLYFLLNKSSITHTDWNVYIYIYLGSLLVVSELFCVFETCLLFLRASLTHFRIFF